VFVNLFIFETGSCWAPVAHAYNPSYSGGRDKEDCSLKPVQASSSRDPISKILNTKRAGGVAQGVGPEFKPQHHNKIKTAMEYRLVLNLQHSPHSTEITGVHHYAWPPGTFFFKPKQILPDPLS
jgi:hypothetical protein